MLIPAALTAEDATMITRLADTTAIKLTALVLAGMLSGCAKSSGEIVPSYVSPMQYNTHSCDQLRYEAQRLSSKAAQLSGVQDDKADQDAFVTAAAIVVFWPAAFFVGGDGQNAAELARVKGEFEAVEQASIRNNCPLRIERR
jgi:hypothetical protein